MSTFSPITSIHLSPSNRIFPYQNIYSPIIGISRLFDELPHREPALGRLEFGFLLLESSLYTFDQLFLTLDPKYWGP